MSNEFYNDSFYESQVSGSYKSAKLFADYLTNLITIESVADMGCGRGTWLKAFAENGIKRVVGFDGEWNNQNQMIDPSIQYIPTDLNNPLTHQTERFDLCISLEVAEHLRKESSVTFISNITSLSDLVMFSAAYKNQGGTNHINEQPHTYWAKIFIDYGYVPYDLFRPKFWGNKEVQFWYQQNTFLYVKKTSSINNMLQNAGYQPIDNIEFMNCIHPILFNSKTQFNYKSVIIKIIPHKFRPLAIKFKRMVFK